jgi:hypothetical protein
MRASCWGECHQAEMSQWYDAAFMQLIALFPAFLEAIDMVEV